MNPLPGGQEARKGTRRGLGKERNTHIPENSLWRPQQVGGFLDFWGSRQDYLWPLSTVFFSLLIAGV